MREFEIKPHLQKIMKKLSKKDKVAYVALIGKMKEIANSQDIEHYKNLRYGLKDRKRVHVITSFVLIFSYDKTNDFISFLDYDHHDNIYKN